MTGGWNPRAEAEAMIGRPARVLEPSPPAVEREPWFADDPLEGPLDGVVVPFGDAPDTWDRLARDDPALAPWCADRWLGAWRPLPPLPAGWEATRTALQRVAAYVVAPARREANGKIGLRYTFRGFGTPFFGAGRQVRIEGTDLVAVGDGTIRREPITTLNAAGALAGIAPDLGLAETFHDLPAPGDPEAALEVDPDGAEFLADWYGLAYSVLEELRARWGDEAPSRVQIWPEHFDAAFDSGDEDAGTRAGYGFSPGDADHPEPYVYVLPWAGVPEGDAFWISTPFAGARLALADITAAGHQRAAVVAFLEEAHGRIHARTG